jgi:hypothetical protein
MVTTSHYAASTRLDNIRHRGVSGLDAAPRILNTGSSRGVSGCTSNLFSHSAADDLDGSNPAGFESEPGPRECHLGAANWEATSVGTMAINPDLKLGGQSVTAVLRMFQWYVHKTWALMIIGSRRTALADER